MIAIKFLCRRFNEIINENKRFREYIKISNGIICKKFVDEIFRKHFLVSGFEIFKGRIDDIYAKSFLRHRFENLLRDISNSNLLSYLRGQARFYKFNNLTIICKNC